MSRVASPTELIALANRFAVSERITAVEPYGSGNINQTYRLRTSAGGPAYILQRLNQFVFPQPDWVMANLATIQAHIGTKLAREAEARRWELPAIIPDQGGADHVRDEAGGFWRLQHFVAGSVTYPAVRDLHHAAEVGYAIGRFHRLIADLAADRLHDTLVGFHHVPSYLADYGRHLAAWRPARVSAEERFCQGFVAGRSNRAGVLEEARRQGRLQLRPIHGDPKVDNILIDTATDQAVGVVDLDTAKPGLIHYDIGDMLRSGCNPLGEREPAWETVRFELDLARALLAAYCREAAPVLTPADYELIGEAIWLIAFEMGLRFFSDYLNGNVYFNVAPEVNLLRALVQFQLVASIEAQAGAIERLVASLR